LLFKVRFKFIIGFREKYRWRLPRFT